MQFSLEGACPVDQESPSSPLCIFLSSDLVKTPKQPLLEACPARWPLLSQTVV